MHVVRLGYLSTSHWPPTVEQAQATCNTWEAYLNLISDSDVDKDAWPVGFLGEADQGRAAFMCPEPECLIIGRMPFYCSTLEQWGCTGTPSM